MINQKKFESDDGEEENTEEIQQQSKNSYENK